jgi:hypothetical protein
MKFNRVLVCLRFALSTFSMWDTLGSANAHEAARCSANGYELRIKVSRETGRHGDRVAFVPETLIGSGA